MVMSQVAQILGIRSLCGPVPEGICNQALTKRYRPCYEVALIFRQRSID